MSHESDHTVEAAKNVIDAGGLELFDHLQAVKHASDRI